MRLVLATVLPLGMLAAVNPCAFPLLPAYLARFSGVGSSASAARRVRKALLDGVAMTAGFVAVFAVLGGAGSLVVHAVLTVAPAALVALGALLFVLAVLAGIGRLPALRIAPLAFPGGSGPLAAAGFGAAYAVGSLGCALPLFAAATSRGVASAGWAGGLAAALGYAVGMGLLVTGVGLVVAVCGAAAGRRLAGLGRHVGVLGAAVTGITGLGLAYVGLREVGLPEPAALAVIQSRAAALLAWSPALLAGVLGAVVVLALAVIAVQELRRPAVGG